VDFDHILRYSCQHFQNNGQTTRLPIIRTATDVIHPMAKVRYLDPRINDNHTYLPWVVTHSHQDSCFQAHIRKFLTS